MPESTYLGISHLSSSYLRVVSGVVLRVIILTRRQPNLLKVSNKTESSKQSSNMAVQHPTRTKIKRVPYIVYAIPSCDKTW